MFLTQHFPTPIAEDCDVCHLVVPLALIANLDRDLPRQIGRWIRLDEGWPFIATSVTLAAHGENWVLDSHPGCATVVEGLL